jgi:nicotinate-nucleotide adenylyltransferase
VDTLYLLRQMYPAATLVYLLGGDSLADLPRWHAPSQLIQACDQIGVMLRPGREVDLPALQAQLPGLNARLRWVQSPLLEISSTEIRRRIAAGLPYRYYLPEAVYAIIARRCLYQD